MATLKKLPAELFIGVAVALLFLVSAIPAHANSVTFQRAGNTAATTSPVFMTAGTATSTYYYDAGVGNNFAADNASFLVQFTGSSTPLSTLNIQFEYSQGAAGFNCAVTPGACDWYKDSLLVGGISTTTQAAGLAVSNSYLLPMASTTLNGVAGNSARTNRIINVPMPTRYVRAVLTLPIGSQNGAAWGEFVGKKQTP